MNKEIKQEVNQILANSKWVLGLGILSILIVPFLLTLPYFNSRFNFSTTGQIGDTIGGTTAPFLNLIGAFLVFYALKAQVRANILVQSQIEAENIARDNDKEAENLNQLYTYLDDNIKSFKFTTLPIEQLRNIENVTTTVEYSGGEAINHLFTQIRCHYHASEEVLHNNQAVAELTSILKIMKLLLEKLGTTNSSNKTILFTLVEHLFSYKMMTRFRDHEDRDFIQVYCDTCQCWHGIPEELRGLILEVRREFRNKAFS